MKKSKRLLSVILVLAMTAAFFTGCSGDKAKDKSGKPVITVVFPGINEKDTIDPISGIEQAGISTFQKFIDEKFKDDAVSVKIVSIPWDGWIQKIEALMTSGEADIGYYTNQVAVPDWFQDLTPILKDDKDLNLDNLDQVFTESAAFYSYYKSFNKPEDTNKIYGLPFTENTYSIIYDKQLFEDWGVPVPEEGVTFPELVKMAQQMTGKNPKTGEKNYGAYIQPAWMEWYSLCYDAVKTVKIDDMDINKLDPATYIDYIKDSPEVLNYFTDMTTLVSCSPEGASTNTGSEKFFTEDNDIAINFNTMNINGTLLLNTYADKKEVTDRFKAIQIPVNSEGYQGFPEFFRLGIGLKTKDTDASWNVLKKILTDKDIVDFYIENYAKDKLPAIQNTDGIKVMDYDINKKRLEYQNKTAFITDDYWYWRVPIQAVNNEVISQTITPEEAREKFYQGVVEWVNNTKAQSK